MSEDDRRTIYGGLMLTMLFHIAMIFVQISLYGDLRRRIDAISPPVPLTQSPSAAQ